MKESIENRVNKAIVQPYRQHFEDGVVGKAFRAGKRAAGVVPKIVDGWDNLKDTFWHKLHNIYIPGVDAHIRIPFTQREITIGWAEKHPADILTSYPFIAAGTGVGTALSVLAVVSALSGWGIVATAPLAASAMVVSFGTMWCYEERVKQDIWTHYQNHIIDPKYDASRVLLELENSGLQQAMHSPLLDIHAMPDAPIYDKALKVVRGGTMVGSNVAIAGTTFFPPAAIASLALRSVTLGADVLRVVGNGMGGHTSDIDKLSDSITLLSQLYTMTDKEPEKVAKESKMSFTKRQFKKAKHALTHRGEVEENPFSQPLTEQEKILQKLEKIDLNMAEALKENLSPDSIVKQLQGAVQAMQETCRKTLQEGIDKDKEEQGIKGMSRRRKIYLQRRIEKNQTTLLQLSEGELLEDENIHSNIDSEDFSDQEPLIDTLLTDKEMAKKALIEYREQAHILGRLLKLEKKTLSKDEYHQCQVRYEACRNTLQEAKEYYKTGWYDNVQTILAESEDFLKLKTMLVEATRQDITELYEKSRFTVNSNEGMLKGKKHAPHKEERYHYYKEAERRAHYLDKLGECGVVPHIAATYRHENPVFSKTHMRKDRDYNKGIHVARLDEDFADRVRCNVKTRSGQNGATIEVC